MNNLKKAITFVLDKTVRALNKALRSRLLRTSPSVQEAQRDHELRVSQFRQNLGNGRLAGKVAIVTGGASGIGRATAILFAREGAKVVVADLKRGAVDEIAAANGDAIYLETDLLIDEQVQAMVAATIQRYGKIDVLVNNAGAVVHGNVVDLPPDKWQRTLDLNLTSAYRCLHYVIPHMMKAGGGSVIMTSSISGICGIMDCAAYATAKAGLIGLTLQTAREFAKNQIRVNAISPGVVQTPILDIAPFLKEKIRLVSEYTPLGFIGIAEDIAHAMLFLASDESSYITGINIVADGGITMRGT